ncbi:MAG: LPS export ABC transporter periplasmic protein LptC [Salinisphaera sp.]|jgi:lipopolysaccharide export system protein LptC|nr:LPS export ABC transporter periplasmic protein LptC [Salinisphaera sp.]
MTLSVAVICAVVVGTTFFYRSEIAHNKPELATPGNSDYYMDGATVYQLNPQGQLAYRLTAAQSLHFPDDSSRFTDIHVHYLSGTDTYWNLAAQKGRIPAGQRNLYLYDGVTGQHPTADGSVVHMTTDHAWVRPDANRIDSDAAVRATQPGQVLEGNGLRINLKTNKLNILNNVHVTYRQ